MSQSPLESSAAGDDEEYQQSWSALRLKLRQGGSFSGYERHCAFLNTGGKRFACVSGVTGFDFLDDGRSIALSDWDLDGDLDLWIANRTAPRLRFLRNDSSSGNHYLALRLRAKGHNRDAIGARVTLRQAGDSRAPQIRTVRAGQGFLSQSSKWIHFGLGDLDVIEGCSVRWPNGETEEIRGLKAGRRHLVVQGEGDAKPVANPLEAVESTLAPSVVEIPPPGPIRAPLALRMPLPPIVYGDFKGEPRVWKSQAGRPSLINVWSPTCAPCAVELREFTKKSAKLRESGLEILALSTDTENLGQTSREFLESINFSFMGGLMASELFKQLRAVYLVAFADARPTEVPLSFLLDADGWVSVIYRGTVSVEQLLADVDLVRQTPAEYLRRTSPFPGRWNLSPLSPVVDNGHFGEVAGLLETGGLVQGALVYWRAYRTYYRKVPRPEDPEIARSWDLDLAGILMGELGSRLRRYGRVDELLETCKGVLRLVPDFAPARLNLGIVLFEARGQLDEALGEFRAVLDDPKVGDAAAVKAAVILAAHPDPGVRDSKEAIRLASRACQGKEAGNPFAFDALAMAYASAGDFGSAVRTATRALDLARRGQQEAFAGQIQTRIALYESGQPFSLSPR